MKPLSIWLLLAVLAIVVQGKSLSTNKKFGIVGGKYVHIRQFPYTVAIYHHKDYEEDVLFGGGAIVYDNWLVTSARQFDGWRYAWNPVTVRAGSDSWQTGGQVIVSDKVIFHPYYRHAVDYDISLVKLRSSLEFGKTVKAIQLPSAYPKGGCKSVVTGWGVPKMAPPGYGIEVTSKQLKAGRVAVKKPDVCQKMYSNYNFTTLHVCADSKNVGPCTFDLGDPLVCKGQLIGFFIGGDICNTWKLIDVYTNVAFHRQWILDTISKNSSPEELARYAQQDAANPHHEHEYQGDDDDDDDDDDSDDSDASDDCDDDSDDSDYSDDSDDDDDDDSSD